MSTAGDKNLSQLNQNLLYNITHIKTEGFRETWKFLFGLNNILEMFRIVSSGSRDLKHISNLRVVREKYMSLIWNQTHLKTCMHMTTLFLCTLIKAILNGLS